MVIPKLDFYLKLTFKNITFQQDVNEDIILFLKKHSFKIQLLFIHLGNGLSTISLSGFVRNSFPLYNGKVESVLTSLFLPGGS